MSASGQVSLGDGERSPRRIIGRWLRRILFLTAVSLLLTTSSVVPEKEFDLRLAPLVASQRFDWVGWETDVLLEETLWWLQGRPLSDEAAQQSAEVRGFLAEQQRMEGLEARIRGEYARLPQSPAESPADSPNDQLSSVKPLERELYELQYALSVISACNALGRKDNVARDGLSVIVGNVLFKVSDVAVSAAEQ